jgi:ribosomal protein L39E
MLLFFFFFFFSAIQCTFTLFPSLNSTNVIKLHATHNSITAITTFALISRQVSVHVTVNKHSLACSARQKSETSAYWEPRATRRASCNTKRRYWRALKTTSMLRHAQSIPCQITDDDSTRR